MFFLIYSTGINLYFVTKREVFCSTTFRRDYVIIAIYRQEEEAIAYSDYMYIYTCSVMVY